MTKENAQLNLQELSKELKLEGLVFDENNSVILGIDNKFSLHITYEHNSDRLYIYSPLLDGLPTDAQRKLKLYEHLLVGSMLGGQMAGGGVGLAVKEELILMHCVLDMGPGVQTNALKNFISLFVETVERWRKICETIRDGGEPEPFSYPTPGHRPAHPAGANQSGSHNQRPSSGFIKI
jgi:hypothetical protein